MTIIGQNYNPNSDNPCKFEALTMDFDAGPIILFPLKTSHDTIAHELLHAAYFILDGRGVNMSDDSQETYAYTIGYITGLVMAFAKKCEGVEIT